MDAQNILNLREAIAGMEQLYSETMQLNGIYYTVIIRSEGLAQKIGPGGFEEVIQIVVSVQTTQFLATPVVGGAQATIRGKNWRVMKVSSNLLTYDITLESPNK